MWLNFSCECQKYMAIVTIYQTHSNNYLISSYFAINFLMFKLNSCNVCILWHCLLLLLAVVQACFSAATDGDIRRSVLFKNGSYKCIINDKHFSGPHRQEILESHITAMFNIDKNNVSSKKCCDVILKS